jgi:acyl-coenzyme A synthetase/AMP-(fatty) acid ligase
MKEHCPSAIDRSDSAALTLPLWSSAAADRPIAWRAGKPVGLSEFARHVAVLADCLPAGSAMINLCEDRYQFLVAYAAAMTAGHTTLLPHTRAEQVVAEIEQAHSGSYCCSDAMVASALLRCPEDDGRTNQAGVTPRVLANHVAMIGFTSGSTGQAKAFPNLWRSVSGSSACTAAAMRDALKIADTAVPWIVATVPPQHTYGMELSILLPLIGGMAVHSGRPLFPADIAAALAEIPEPRVLVSTPVHLRAIVESSQEFPRTALIVSATAPLDATLAAAAEKKLGGQLLEVFGSTETCAFARRRTAVDKWWRLYTGVTLQPIPDGTLVNAPWFAAPTLLQDVVEPRGSEEFIVRGRNTDLIEVAGKRASLADLTRRLQAIAGVKDAVVFQPEQEAVGTIRRVAALVVAPGLTAKEIIERLAPGVDSAFIPRPLVIVEALPRNELGKLPLGALLRAMKGSASSASS